MESRTSDTQSLARSYIDAALRIQGDRRPSQEHYERAVAKAEAAFRELELTRGERSQQGMAA